MPDKLKLALGLMGIGVLLAVVGERWFSVVVNVALMFGVWRGNESVRKILIVLSWIGLIIHGIVGALALVATAALVGLAIVALLASVWGAVQCAYLIWALNQPDVQQWMFNRSLKLV